MHRLNSVVPFFLNDLMGSSDKEGSGRKRHNVDAHMSWNIPLMHLILRVKGIKNPLSFILYLLPLLGTREVTVPKSVTSQFPA